MTYSQEEHDKVVSKKDAEIADLKRQIANFNSSLYGSKSEKSQGPLETNPNQPFLGFPGADFLSEPENEEKASSKTKLKSKSKKSGGNRMVFPEDIETEDLVLSPPESERTNPETGNILPKISEEITEKLILQKAKWKKLRIIKPVYGGGKKYGVVKAVRVESVLGYSQFDETVVADILTRRFCDHTPFYRICEIYQRDELFTTRQTLNKLALDFSQQPLQLGKLLKEEILKLNSVHMDETPVKMQMKGKGKLHQAYMWLLCGSPPGAAGPLIWMKFEDNRQEKHVKYILGDYKGILHSDAYSGYEKLAPINGYSWAMCWVHARRKFIKATECDLQKTIVKMMSKIMGEDNKTDDMAPEARLTYRQEKLTPMVDDFIKHLETVQYSNQVLVSKSLSEACSYFLKRLDSFKCFLNHSEAKMDNNAAERLIRPFTIGRKNWLFVGSKRGGDSSAILYSLLQSCRSIGVNPRDYIENVMRRLPYTAKEDLIHLLPHKWLKKENPISPYLPYGYNP